MKNLNNRWTIARLVNLSQDLGNAYCPNLNQATEGKENGWTTERLIQMSNSLAQAYNLGL